MSRAETEALRDAAEAWDWVAKLLCSFFEHLDLRGLAAEVDDETRYAPNLLDRHVAILQRILIKRRGAA